MEQNGQWKVNQELLNTLPESIRGPFLEFESYKLNMGLMGQIAAQMKEIPVHPSEVPPEGDRNPLQRVEFLDEGGVMTYMEGYELPYRGFPLAENVDKIDVIKKIAKASVSGMYHSLKDRKWLIVFLLPAVLVFRDLINAVVYTFYRLIERFRVKPIRLSQCMRDLHRAFGVESDLTPKMSDLRTMLRDVTCNILEFDNAYRFRAQDIIEEMDREALKKNTIKELLRLLKVMQSRETTQEIRDTWKLGKLFVSFYLRFDKKLQSMVRDVLLDINVDQFKLTPEDKQFCVKRKDYVFGFMK